MFSFPIWNNVAFGNLIVARNVRINVCGMNGQYLLRMYAWHVIATGLINIANGVSYIVCNKQYCSLTGRRTTEHEHYIALRFIHIAWLYSMVFKSR